jgi:protein-arginine kinase activator protein McsA
MSAAPVEKTDLKRRIRTLKAEIASALEAQEGLKAKRMRRKVKLLKRATRRAPKVAAPAEPAAS